MKKNHIPPKIVQKRVYEIAAELDIDPNEVKRTYYEVFKDSHEKTILILRDRLLIKYFLPEW